MNAIGASTETARVGRQNICHRLRLRGPGYRTTNAARIDAAIQTAMPTTRCHSPAEAPQATPASVGTENASAPAHHHFGQMNARVAPKTAPTTAEEPTKPALKLTAHVPNPPIARPMVQPPNRAIRQTAIPVILLRTLIAPRPATWVRRAGLLTQE